MGHHPKSASPSSNSYNLLGIISKATSIAEICKAFTRKWQSRKNSNRDRAESHSHSNSHSINETYRGASSRKRDQEASFNGDKQRKSTDSDKRTWQNSMQYEEEEEEEELVISDPKLLSRTTSRLAPTTPRLSKSTSKRSTTPKPMDFYAHMQRSTSISVTPGSLAKMTSERGATPIIYSESVCRRKPPAVERKLECTLEELCFGCAKEVKITRECISNEGLIIQEEEYVTIMVKPEWRKGTRITFEGKGDERPGYHPADIIFVIEEKKHQMFQRVGDDLELGVKIPLVQALTGCTINVPKLGGGKMVLNVDDEIIYPGQEKIIPGQGMPKYNEQGSRGDLRLRFLVSFPTDLSEEQRSQVASILKDCC